MNPCEALTKSGELCKAAAMPGSDFCPFHDPALAASRAASRRAGGHARHGRKIGPVGVQTVAGDAPTVQDIAAVLWAELKIVSGKEESMSRARTIAYLSEKILKALEVGELAERLEALERIMNKHE